MARTSESGSKLCDCGCGGELKPGAIANGVHYLRGHKPVGIHTTKNIEHRRLPPSGVIDTCPESIKSFAILQCKLLQEQLNKAHNHLMCIQDQVRQLELQDNAWAGIINNLDLITPKEVKPCLTDD